MKIAQNDKRELISSSQFWFFQVYAGLVVVSCTSCPLLQSGLLLTPKPASLHIRLHSMISTFRCISHKLSPYEKSYNLQCSRLSKTSVTLALVRAEVSSNLSPFYTANYSAFSLGTCLSAGFISTLSTWLPTRHITQSGSALAFSSSIHLFALMNVSSFVTS